MTEGLEAERFLVPQFYLREVSIELYEMIKAFSWRLHFSHPRSKIINPNTISNEGGAEFEDVICSYVDAVAVAKKIRNVSKRAILIYKAMGYDNWEIAIYLGISERTVNRLIKSIKIFCRKV